MEDIRGQHCFSMGHGIGVRKEGTWAMVRSRYQNSTRVLSAWCLSSAMGQVSVLRPEAHTFQLLCGFLSSLYTSPLICSSHFTSLSPSRLSLSHSYFLTNLVPLQSLSPLECIQCKISKSALRVTVTNTLGWQKGKLRPRPKHLPQLILTVIFRLPCSSWSVI